MEGGKDDFKTKARLPADSTDTDGFSGFSGEQVLHPEAAQERGRSIPVSGSVIMLSLNPNSFQREEGRRLPTCH